MLFITFEGGEGAGKSTLAKKVYEELRQHRDVLFTREPGGTKFGEEARTLILHARDTVPIGAKAELFLFLAARIQHVEEVIRPQLLQGKIVLCDRFSDSTVAYQGAGRDLGIDYVERCTELAVQGCTPDITFLVDIDPEMGLKRASRRTAFDHIEKEQLCFHQKVRAGFLEVARKHPERVIVLDGTKTKQELFQEAMNLIFARISS